MNANRSANSVPNLESTPTGVPQVVPRTDVGLGHPEYHFVQGLMEVQKSLVEISTNLAHVTKAVDAMKIKLDDLAPLPKTVDGIKTKVDDLVQWKTMILGGAIVLGVVLSIATVVIKYGSDYFMLKPDAAKVEARPSARVDEPVAAPPPVIVAPVAPAPSVKTSK